MPNTSVTILSTAISDHYAQELSIGGCLPDREPPVVTTRRMLYPENIRALKSQLSQEKWEFINEPHSADNMFNLFNKRFLFHLDLTCPFQTKFNRPRRVKNTWITRGILVSREKLKFYSEIVKSSQNETFKIFFKNYKKNLPQSY